MFAAALAALPAIGRLAGGGSSKSQSSSSSSSSVSSVVSPSIVNLIGGGSIDSNPGGTASSSSSASSPLYDQMPFLAGGYSGVNQLPSNTYDDISAVPGAKPVEAGLLAGIDLPMLLLIGGGLMAVFAFMPKGKLK